MCVCGCSGVLRPLCVAVNQSCGRSRWQRCISLRADPLSMGAFILMSLTSGWVPMAISPHLILSGQTTQVLWFDLLCLSQTKINTLRKWLSSKGVTLSVFMVLSLFNLVIYLSTKRIYGLFRSRSGPRCPLTARPHQLCFRLMSLRWARGKTSLFGCSLFNLELLPHSGRAARQRNNRISKWEKY